MPTKTIATVTVAILTLQLPSLASAQEAKKPFVHALFSSHMVLQRDKQVPVWGWTKPGTLVTVQLGSKLETAVAGGDGKWSAKIGPFKANAMGETLEVAGGGDSKRFDDVLVGDVWICSGQSNMEWSVALSNNADSEIANGDHPSLRLFTVPKRVSSSPQELVEGTWTTCTPKSLPAFSAVGYFFGRELNKELQIPIGLIHTSWGGTIAEAWTSGPALNEMDDFREAVADFERAVKEMAAGKFDLAKRVAEWWGTHDAGSKPGSSWSQTSADHRNWKTMTLPDNWETANVGMDGFDGIVWFRREFELPSAWAGKDVILSLGAIDDADTTWVNGHEVGGMNLWNQPRNYTVKATHLKPGKNVIAIRVFDGNGGGGIYDKKHAMAVQLAADKSQTVSIGGDWYYKVSAPMSKLTAFPESFNQNPNKVTVLYNGMLAPLKPFGITGAIWYQGESNAGRPTQYRRLLPTMIKDWRNQFEQGDFPFLVVQLANFMQRQTRPVESGWAELREAQQMTAQQDKNVGLAVITDIGEANDIHPRNKQDVGKRLALQALGIQYKRDVVHSGPTVKDMGVRGDSVVLDFANVGGGLVAKGDKLSGFAIAEKEGDFVWAEAEIKGDSIVLWNEALAEPIRVRYNWANNPIGNLFNKEGLPAAPFRTDRR